MAPTHPLEEILHPKSIAVTGASNTPGSWGYGYTRYHLDYGFPGKIYPVNPKYSEIAGIKAYPSLSAVPDSVDYVISCVPAAEVLEMLEQCAQKGVKAVQLFTARFSETGRPEAAELEQEILKRAKKLGIRLLGPNCMGIYYPRERLTFSFDLPKESGVVGLVSQSGGGAVEIVRATSLRGVYFSKAITYGNAIDFNECDYLEYFSQDPETKIILMYIEGVKDGRRFFNLLRQTTPSKPVIIAKGGRGESGTRAVASHTASLAGSTKIWQALLAQTGAIEAENFDELADLALAFYSLPPIRNTRVGIAGMGGGAGVLAADQCEEAGLEVIPLPREIREELKTKGNPIWDWIGNPVDMSIRASDDFNANDMLQMMARNKNFDLLITTMWAPFRRGQPPISIENYVEQYKPKGNNPKPLLVIVADRSLGINDYNDESWKLSCEVRTKLIEANIPFYPTIKRAARAASKLIDYYQRQEETRTRAIGQSC